MRRTRATANSQLAFHDPVHNRKLFADHFLAERLVNLPQWHDDAGIDEAFDAINELFQQRGPGLSDRTNEDQTERSFIQPVLDILWADQRPGDCYEVEVSIPGEDSRRQPDYAFFPHADDRQQAGRLKGSIEYWQHAACLGDAKKWTASLETRRGGGENPSDQIGSYLYRSGTRWGILTNGRIWRLYEQDRSRSGGVYYEVDLEAILRNRDREAFKHFYMFFRRQAFVPDRPGKSFLETVLQGSDDYATEVGDSLKESVYDALRLLMNGFCERPENALDAADPHTLELVHENALIVLYRLLFVLFAEDLGLLPHDDQYYDGYSLRRLQGEINSELSAGRTYLPASTGLWGRLCNIFSLIDTGYESDGLTIIPAYNGGLFSAEKHPHVAHAAQPGTARWNVGDDRLSQVIDMLAYRRDRWDEPGSQTVDYATLKVQHLGAIYEGLLELRPQLAAEPMIEQPGPSGKPPVVKKKSEIEDVKKVRGQTPRRFQAGEVYLVTDRGERKATGSYYTPDYIVNYIVDHTVGPLAEQAAEETARRWQQLGEKYGLQKPDELDGLMAQKPRAQQRQVAEEKAWLLEPYLSLKILDPAMGSGHFLVGAADFLSMAMATDPSLPAPEGIGEDQVQAHYKRLVVEHCLYGVDLNELAVELAKLSLWLHTVSQDKALSFLDHHLRCGNSLIGARLEEDLRKPPPRPNGKGQDSVQLQLGFDETLRRNDLAAFLDAFQRIAQAPGGTATSEHQKDSWYREMDRRRDRYRQVANLWLAPYFGLQVTPEQYGQALEALRDGEGTEAWQAVCEQEWFKQAQEIAGQRRFFHWELEFPEAFFEAHNGKADWRPADQRGFDAVIGNPPWVVHSGRQAQELTLGLRRVYAARYKGTGGWLSTHGLFLELSRDLVAAGGFVSLIVPAQLGHLEGYAAARRAALRDTVQIGAARIWGENAFEGVTEPSITITLRKHHPSDEKREVAEAIEIENATGQAACRNLLAAMDRFDTLAPSAFGDPGVHSGNAAADILTDDRPSAPSARIREGRDVLPYHLEDARLWLRTDVRLPDNKYCTIRQLDSYLAAKALIRQTASRPIAAPHTCPTYFRNSVLAYYGVEDLTTPYVLALLNSQAVALYHRASFRDSDHDAFPQVKVAHLRRLPIRTIDFDHPTEGDAKQQLMQRCREAIESGDYQLPLHLAQQGLATHARLHGPAGKPELQDDPYWAEQIAQADPDFPGREDFVHDLLAELAQRMMDLNREKHEIISRFETDLRGQADADLHERLQKGKQGRTLYKHERSRPYVAEDSHATHQLHESLGWSQDAFEAFVRELAGRVSNLSDLVAVYDAYADDYRRVTEALQSTDELIDRIVYALYGLTEDEIAIVEQATT